jgi:hypothetical protein
MKRRMWVPATALFLSSVMAAVGSFSQEAVAGIAALSLSTGASIVPDGGPGKIRYGPVFDPHPTRDVSARYWMRGIVLLILILLILWLIYRTFTGWKPLLQ